jgi:hypothetical protein
LLLTTEEVIDVAYQLRAAGRDRSVAACLCEVSATYAPTTKSGGTLLQTPLGTRVEARLFRDGDEFHSPHLVDVEVTQGLRRLVRSGEVSPGRAAEAIADLVDLDLHRHSHVDLLTRVDTA